MRFKKTDRPPIANRVDTIRTAHGKRWVDHYAWLRAENWQEALTDAEKLPLPIAEYLQAENQYYEQATADLLPLQTELIAEMRGRMAENDDSISLKDGPYLYSERYIKNEEHELYLRVNIESGKEEILFDVNCEARRHEYFELGQIEHSPDHSKLLWSSDTTGSEYYTLRIRDLSTGNDRSMSIEHVDMATWVDNNTIVYTRLNDAHRALLVFKHILGTSVESDTLLFEEQDMRFSCSVYTSLSSEYLFIHSSTDDQDEVWFLPSNNLSADITLIQGRTEGLEYGVDHQGDRFIICTNTDNAQDFKIVETSIHDSSMHRWKDLFPYTVGRMIEDVVVYEDWLVWLENVNALPQIAYMNNAGETKWVKFNEEAYCLELISSLEFDTQSILFEYSSPTTPTQTYEVNLRTSEQTLLKEEIIPSGHQPKNYITRRIVVPSHDGINVPVTLLYRHDTPIDGSAPALLYGYGSYGASSEAEFRHDRLSLVDRGFVFAIAHVRGGQENGRAWYEDAKLELKPNSFHDFIAVGNALIAQGFCDAKKVVSLGGSAGGLLVGASMNMKPELFAGVIAQVPFVDVLNTILDDTLPLTPSEWPQWGNPIESEAAFESIRSYSPYENTKPVEYPPLYVTAGVSDPRVTYWEPAKWVANLRATKTDDNIVLLKTNMQSGHFGKTGRFAELDDRARAYAFAIAVTDD